VRKPFLFIYVIEKKGMDKCVALAPNEVPPLNFFTIVHFGWGFLFGYVLRLLVGPGFDSLIVFLTFLSHVIFEVWESTPGGIAFFNHSVWENMRQFARDTISMDLWCTYTGDSWANSIFDIIGFTIGAVFGVWVASAPNT
jgi:hypothetical protein